MEYVANFMSVDRDPLAWARDREAEGWDVLGCADHLWTDRRAYPHVWVTLGAMAAVTTRPRLTSSFANNLFRTPVEFAQASLQMQAVSGGRFEAGLGAAWTREEVEGMGLAYPTPGERAVRYGEAVRIVRALFDEGRCSFTGEHYSVDVAQIGPRPTMGPPPLVASLGGPKTIRLVAPVVDRVELKLISAATRGGQLDIPALASIPEQHLHDLVARVRDQNPSVPLGVFILCSVGDDARTTAVSSMLGDTFLGRFFGDAPKVADALRSLADAGVDRVQVSPFADRCFELLASELF